MFDRTITHRACAPGPHFLTRVLPYGRALDDGGLLRAPVIAPKNVAPIHPVRLKAMWRFATRIAVALAPAASEEGAFTENSPKGERPRPWAMAGSSSSRKQAASQPVLRPSHNTSDAPRFYWPGLSKQEMVEIGRFGPKPSPCLNKGRCSLRWSYPDTLVRVAQLAAL
ncbi:hypothetical protein D9M68_780330 [compost metagenome]